MIWTAKWLGIASFCLAAILSIQIIALRVRLVLRERRAERVHMIWEPIFISCLDDTFTVLPELEERDIPTFLVLWNYFHETLRDAGKDNLNSIAKRLELDAWSTDALDKGTIRTRLLAIQTLGWLRESGSWDKFVEIMNEADPVTSLCAARALLRIDPTKAIHIFIRLAAVKTDWSFAMVGKQLKECGSDLVSEPLIDTMEKLQGEELVRLLRFVDLAYADRSAPLISFLLMTSDDVDVLVNCLNAVVNPEDLPVVRGLLKHDDWKVRMKAAVCLGNMGTEADIPRLTHAAGDQDWWVRNRAAAALAELPSMTPQRLQDIANNHHNFYATESITKTRQEMEALRQ